MMRTLKALPFLLIFLAAQSCCLFRRIPDEVHHRDSVVITYKDSTAIKDSVVYITIPKEEIVNVTLPNQVSHLHTSLAESTASTDSLGFLHHTLKNRSSEKIPVIVFNKEFYHKAESMASKSDLTVKTVLVEKKLNWWQRFRLKSFWWLLLILLIENAIIIFAINKRFIFKH